MTNSVQKPKREAGPALEQQHCYYYYYYFPKGSGRGREPQPSPHAAAPRSLGDKSSGWWRSGAGGASGCEGKLGVALESLQGLRDLT